MEMHKYKLLNYSTRKVEVNKPEPLLDIKEAFSKFSSGGNHMSKDQLLQFMVEYQGEKNCTLLDLEPVVEKVLQVGSSRQGLCLSDFIDFLLLDDFNGPIKDEVCTFSVSV